MNFGLHVGTILLILRIEEELLCEAQSCSRSVVLGGYVFAFQLTININFMNPARRPQDAFRQRRGGMKED